MLTLQLNGSIKNSGNFIKMFAKHISVKKRGDIYGIKDEN